MTKSGSTKEEAVVCPSCGQASSVNASFCQSCGAQLSDAKRTTPPRPPMGPMVSGAFAILTILASTQTWARALFISLSGTDADRGLITLVAAFGGAVLCTGRLLFGIRDRWYYGFGLTLGLIAFSMPMWFLVDIYSQPPTEFFDEEVRLVDPGLGVFLALIGSFGYGTSLGWQFFRKKARQADAIAPDAADGGQ